MTKYIDLETLTNWAATHETDFRIAEAIAYLAEGDTNIAERIWQEPTDAEIVAVYERATENGLNDENDMAWGTMTLAEALERVDECEICSAAGIYTPAENHTDGFKLCDDCYDEFLTQMKSED